MIKFSGIPYHKSLNLGMKLMTDVFLLLCNQQTHKKKSFVLCNNEIFSVFYISINISLVKGAEVFSIYEEAL